MAIDFFNFPGKVGEIIMKYFNSAFMKFTVNIYSIKWKALEIGIVMGLRDFPASFRFGHGIDFTRRVNHSHWNDGKKHLVLPPSRTFMDDIHVPVLYKIAANDLVQICQNFFSHGQE